MSQFVIGFFVEKRLSFTKLKGALKKTWCTKAPYFISTNKNLFYFRFTDEEIKL